MFIDFFFSPYSLIKISIKNRKNCFLSGFSLSLVFITKTSEFCQIFHALLLFKALRLFFLPNFPGPTFISCLTSISESTASYSPDPTTNFGTLYKFWIFTKFLTRFVLTTYVIKQVLKIRVHSFDIGWWTSKIPSRFVWV